MGSPTVLVFLLLGTAYALLFHLWSGRNIQHLVLFWLMSILGFGIGFVLAGLLHLQMFLFGGVPILEASIGALVMLFVARWLVS